MMPFLPDICYPVERQGITAGFVDAKQSCVWELGSRSKIEKTTGLGHGPKNDLAYFQNGFIWNAY